MKSSTLSPKSTGIISSSRRTTNLSTRPPPPASGRLSTVIGARLSLPQQHRHRVTVTLFQTSSCTGLAT